MKLLHKICTYIIAAVWLINGLYCKVFNFVPRHEQIVARILGDEYSRFLTILIGISEIVMAVWIISGYKRIFNMYIQIAIVATMNILEFFLVPDLLLWGKWNAIFAFLFIGLVYWNGSQQNKIGNK